MFFLSNVRYLRISKNIIKSATPVRNIVNCNGEDDGSNGDHIFKKLWTKSDLLEHISRNVHYEDDECVVVNKPYGILSRVNETAALPSQAEPPACSTTLTDILPDLSVRFGSENLSILLNPERCFSGVTILWKGEGSKGGSVLRNFSGISERNRVYSFLTVVLGHPPQTLEGSFRVISRKEKKSHEILDTPKKKRIKGGGLTVGYKHEVLASTNEASLVKVDLNYNYLHCLRLVLSTKCFSPVLGDFLYSRRVTTLFEVPLLVSPNSGPPSKILRPEILRSLLLTPQDVDCCPCHIHLRSTTFRFREKKFVVAVPPPDYFVWTCERLGLEEIRHFCLGIEYWSESSRAQGH